MWTISDEGEQEEKKNKTYLLLFANIQYKAESIEDITPVKNLAWKQMQF